MPLWAWLFSFRGRIGRGRFWAAVVVYLGISIPALRIANAALESGTLTETVLSAFFGLVLLFSFASVQVKRFHDRGKSGWWLLLAVVSRYSGGAMAFFSEGDLLRPIGVAAAAAATLWLLVDLGIRKGQHGANRYGPDPQPRKAGAVFK